ncbi:MAG TPA: hypothetical protein VJ698_15740 [Noviherbaspirillum sp.]|uniref:hypothetical protein n=1 Tax=Noviherbaspirillum sp. TaxID=1926288 RepID=UPI002B49B02C|nr:hypothetical protein [Noviherbaspirillum sp.]HJV86918.1 hypothetical protein [Noviherbaspirillum sp.]
MAGLIGSSGSKNLRVKEFRSSGTFPVPSGVKTVSLFLVGGGAGGASSYLGQGGNVVEVNYDVDGKASCAVVIGAGGASAANGGNTSFDGVVFACGGGAYGAVQSSTVPQIGGTGKSGFGGHGANGSTVAAANGAVSAESAPSNTGAGAPNGMSGGSGYCRVEWYE